MKNDFMSGHYTGFGTGVSASLLMRDLLKFKVQQRKLNSPFFSFWAVFDQDQTATEDEFENKMWAELSAVHEFEVKNADLNNSDDLPWDKKFSRDPQNHNFCFCVGGDAYFVVGMHQASSRFSRRFPYPVVIFNLYSQFEDLMKKENFDSMVQVNRQREIKFEGSVNPMVEKHGQSWEAIQFSGRNNGDQWSCPFKKIFSLAKL